MSDRGVYERKKKVAGTILPSKPILLCLSRIPGLAEPCNKPGILDFPRKLRLRGGKVLCSFAAGHACKSLLDGPFTADVAPSRNWS